MPWLAYELGRLGERLDGGDGGQFFNETILLSLSGADLLENIKGHSLTIVGIVWCQNWRRNIQGALRQGVKARGAVEV